MRDSDLVIRVEGLGKKYSLHHEQGERDTHFRDLMVRQGKAAGRLLNPFTLASQLRRAQRQAAQEHVAGEEEFWALKDVSFEIRRGERVGIIGRNGAGKSTLLKILSRITEPTTGRVEICGRVASLLEVGTGFHPELTGRENIYLNGAILGMTRREIRFKFDEIVDFAEVEKFLDTPVKRYSSGMYVRLAFAVAAHLEPEILVVDEVLAVGDASFQNKCLGKMEEVADKDGRTVLFVSHNMAAIKELCGRGILLRDGSKECDGDSGQAIDTYLKGLTRKIANRGLINLRNRENTGRASITGFKLLDDNNMPLEIASSGCAVSIETTFRSTEELLNNLRLGITFRDISIQRPVADLNTYYQSKSKYSCPNGEHKFVFRIDKLTLGPGTYTLSCILTSGTEVLDWIKEAKVLLIKENDYHQSGKTPDPGNYPLFWIDFTSFLMPNILISSQNHE